MRQITNTHVRHKHPEFATFKEFCAAHGIENPWSDDLRAEKSASTTGKKRGPYVLTERFREGMKKAAKSRTGEKHWNWGKNWSDEARERISNGMKSSQTFYASIRAQWKDPVRRRERLRVVNELVVPLNLAKRAEQGLITLLKDKPEFDAYMTLVRRLTRRSFQDFSWWIDPENLFETGEFDVDHMFSKVAGFRLGVPAEIIASPANLMLLPRRL